MARQKHKDSQEWIIQESPSITGNNYDPVSLLKTANMLISLGKDEAIRLIRIYLKGSKFKPYSKIRELKRQAQGILLCRTLFATTPGRYFRAPFLGEPVLYSLKLLDNEWQRLPLEFVDDIPFLVVSGYVIAGKIEKAEDYILYCLKKQLWHGKPYALPSKEQASKALQKLLERIPALDNPSTSFLQEQVERIKSPVAKFHL